VPVIYAIVTPQWWISATIPALWLNHHCNQFNLETGFRTRNIAPAGGLAEAAWIGETG
jgi:hypothetical protein